MEPLELVTGHLEHSHGRPGIVCMFSAIVDSTRRRILVIFGERIILPLVLQETLFSIEFSKIEFTPHDAIEIRLVDSMMIISYCTSSLSTITF